MQLPATAIKPAIPLPMTKHFYAQAFAKTHPGPTCERPPSTDTTQKANKLTELGQQLADFTKDDSSKLSKESRLVPGRIRTLELPKDSTEKDKEIFYRIMDKRRNAIHIYERERLTSSLLDYIEMKLFKALHLL